MRPCVLTDRPSLGRKEGGRVGASSQGGGHELGSVFAWKMEVCCGQAAGTKVQSAAHENLGSHGDRGHTHSGLQGRVQGKVLI